MKLLIASLLIASLVMASSFLHPVVTPADATSPDPNSCGSKCGIRCSKAAVKERCMKYCTICCQQCNCVPSGTYGNKHECPCYRDKLNPKGKPKCP